MSKAALENLTLQAAVELAPWKIRVNSISPGWFRTQRNEFVYQNPGELARRHATIPLARIGAADDDGVGDQAVQEQMYSRLLEHLQRRLLEGFRLEGGPEAAGRRLAPGNHAVGDLSGNSAHLVVSRLPAEFGDERRGRDPPEESVQLHEEG